MGASFNELIKLPIGALPEGAMGVICNCLAGAYYNHYHLREMNFRRTRKVIPHTYPSPPPLPPEAHNF